MGNKDSDRVGHMSSDQVLKKLNHLWLQLGKILTWRNNYGGIFFYPAFAYIPRGRNRFSSVFTKADWLKPG